MRVRFSEDARVVAVTAIHTPFDAECAPPACVSMAAPPTEDVTVLALRAEVAALAAIIATQQSALAHSRDVFDRASAAARIGVWECNLRDESLRWTDAVFDFFDLPRDVVPSREQALACYSEDSRRTLERLRSKAIEECQGFEMDALIVTQKGSRRWIRITATIESENGAAVRIFGMKQDITEQKTLLERTRTLAESDCLTGLANRNRFQAHLSLEDGCGPLCQGALLLIDLDGFKTINDTHGHAVGDACLQEAAARLQAACLGADLVARIGGDEFAVLSGRDFSRARIEELSKEIVDALSRPVMHGTLVLRLGASIGIAWAEGCECAADLYMMADTALYAAKAAGRGTFRVYDSLRGEHLQAVG